MWVNGSSLLILKSQVLSGSQALKPSINTAAKLTLITEVSTVKHSTCCGNNRDTLESNAIPGIKS